ncbi:MAG: DUF6522 family protein [Proteobacteria bacterium]|nr:DUF6522 family protein [Pseudomonadota bacterium]
MKVVERDGDGFIVDAALLSRAFGLPVADVRQMMRDGRITSRCEAGVDADAGRRRLTFLHDGRTFRLTVDGAGKILRQSTFVAPRRTG